MGTQIVELDLSNPKPHAVITADTREQEELDAALAAIDAINFEDIEVVEPVEAVGELEVPEVLDADTERALEGAIARSESYEEQTTSTDLDPLEIAAATAEPKATVKAKAPAKPRAPKVPGAAVPRAAKTADDLPGEAFVLSAELIGGNLADNKTAVLARRPTQKKISEKFDNLLISLSAGKKPSTYIMQCFTVLDAKGEVTTSELVKVLMSSSVSVGKTAGSTYDEGTARSQVGQIMVLFSALDIAERSGPNLKKLGDSVLASKLRALIAPTA